MRKIGSIARQARSATGPLAEQPPLTRLVLELPLPRRRRLQSGRAASSTARYTWPNATNSEPFRMRACTPSSTSPGSKRRSCSDQTSSVGRSSLADGQYATARAPIGANSSHVTSGPPR